MKLIKTLSLALIVLATNAYAITDASKVGANAGAMVYCYDHVASSDQRSKYQVLKLQSYEQYKDLPSNERARALLMKKAAEDGDYLGDRLDKRRCDSLRKMFHIQYN
ncbi:hypothetical protein AB6E21_07775 [Photobacterium swingsii]|uniref:hypothetical protein n=1 Tax=Photobacterium swingsii TaxID=680026 RepID=UPI0035537122